MKIMNFKGNTLSKRRKFEKKAHPHGVGSFFKLAFVAKGMVGHNDAETATKNRAVHGKPEAARLCYHDIEVFKGWRD